MIIHFDSFSVISGSFKLSYMNRKLSDQQKIEIVEKYLTGNYNCEQIAKIYGVRRNTVNSMLRRRDVIINNDRSKLRRKYTLNEFFFEKIDSEAKAYCLGMLSADGCNSENRGQIALYLEQSDSEILEKMKEKMGINGPILIRGAIGAQKPQRGLVFTSHKMSRDLAILGCVQRKSLVLEFPTEGQVPKALLKHYIRGYFDGDGSLSNSKRGKDNHLSRYRIVIASSTAFCLKLRDFIELGLFLKTSFQTITESGLTSAVAINGQEDVHAFMSWLYEDATIFMKRKHDKFLEFENFLRTRTITRSDQFSLPAIENSPETLSELPQCN